MAPARQLTAGFVALAAIAAGGLAGCSSKPDESLRGTVGFVRGFLGGVVADEPRAALIGREILAAGGSAVDAAVATYFALSVTLPSHAGLGGGGMCVVHDPVKNETNALDFLSAVPRAVPIQSDRPSAVPGNPRGFFTLHSRYGRLKWPQLVAPATGLARFGTPVSRAFATDIAKVAQPLAIEPEARRIFGRPDGALAREGDLVRQVELAAVLERLRTHGPGDFYLGPFARRLAAAANAAGGSLDVEDLRHYAPVWRDTVKLELKFSVTAHFAPPPAAAGAVAAEIVGLLNASQRFAKAPAADRPHLFVEAALRAFADRARWLRDDGSSAIPVDSLVSEGRLKAISATIDPAHHVAAERLVPAPVERPENPAATTIIAADPEGGAVACALTMNNLFGTGRIALGTGILLAAVPGPSGRGPISLGPMIIFDKRDSALIFAGAASGGVAAPTALANVAVRTLLAEEGLEEALAARRLHHGGTPDIVFHESGYDEEIVRELIRRGHRVAATPVLGIVNALSCPGGLLKRPGTCSLRPDPRGFGLAATSD